METTTIRNEQLATNKQYIPAEGEEIISLRGRNIKHFDLGLRRKQAVIYGDPVHFKGENGQWEEIDNRLEEAKDAEGNAIYRTHQGEFRAEFAREGRNSRLVTVFKDEVPFFWTCEGEKENVIAGVTELFDENEKANAVSMVEYQNLFPGFTARYTVSGVGVKEEFRAENAEALAHAVLCLPEGFDYAAQEDGSVAVNRDGEWFAVINKPFTYDAEHRELATAAVLTKEEDHVLLRYEIQAEALKEAVFPVVIDPLISFSKTQSNVTCNYITNRQPTTVYANQPYMITGTSYTSGVYEYVSLIRFNELAALKASDTVLSAYVNIKPTENGTANTYFGIYEIKTPWTATNATWNSLSPNTDTYISSDLISYVDNTVTTPSAFDVTKLYRGWYLKDSNGNSLNYGIALRHPSNCSGTPYQEWYGGTIDNYKPYLVVNYVSHAGRKPWWKYESMAADRAGAAYVDLYNGNLVAEAVDTATIGNRMPVSVSRVYNSCQALSNAFHCGKGWRLSLNQTITRKAIGNSAYYIWQDGDGTDHYFEISGSQPYKDCEGMNLKLAIDGSVITITDKGGTVMRFPTVAVNGLGNLQSITDSCGNVMTLTYTSGKLTKATDGIGRETKFTYNSSTGYLEKITAPGCPDVTYTYSSGNLTKVHYSDLTSTQNVVYTYGNSLLTSMKNFDSREVAITFESNLNASIIEGYTVQGCRVTAMEFKNGSTNGVKSLYSYAVMRTVVTKPTTASGTTGKQLTYHFNEAGNVVSVNDGLWHAIGTVYDSGIENSPSDDGRMLRPVINRMRNADFNNSYWSVYKANSGDSCTKDYYTQCMSMVSMKMVKSAAGEVRELATADLFASGKYTLSAYVKISSALTLGTSGKGAYLRVIANGVTYESLPIAQVTTGFENGSFAAGWERLSVTFPFTYGSATTVAVQLVCDAKSGTVWFSCPQLEEGEMANHFNLAVNSDFMKTVNNTQNSSATRLFPAYWDVIGAGVSTSTENCVVTSRAVNGLPDTASGNALRLFSEPERSSIYMAHEVAARGNAGDIFVIGGWANTNSLSHGAGNFLPAIKIRFYNPTNSVWMDWQDAYFTTENGSWQFISKAVAAPLSYTKLQIAVAYPRNCKTGMFTHIFVNRELFGQSLAYDSNGNVTSVKNLANQQSAATYDSFDNLLSYVQPGSASTDKYLFTYGSTDADKKRRLPLTSATPMGVKTATTYDTYGNALTSTLQPTSSGALIRTETTYTSNGNYVQKQKDARGNQVTNTVDSNGKVTAVTDPNGQVVNYEYDAANRITGVNTTVSSMTYRNAYTYENDQLKTVAHNTTSNTSNDVVYTFNYDALGRQTSVKVGSQTLSTNVYNSDRWGLLNEVQYGNGGKVKYAYDDFGRMTGIAYDGVNPSTAPQYEIKYDSMDVPAVLKDNVLNRQTETAMDMSNRPCKLTLRDSNGNLIHRSYVSYDNKSRVSVTGDELPNENHQTAFTYDKDNRPTEVKYDNSTSTKVAYTYDLLNRITKKVATNSSAYTTNYAFVAGNTGYGSTATTPLVSSITQGSGSNAMNFSYAYDNRGNITSETRNSVTTTYVYDAIGQLTRVNSPVENATWVYTYDRGGNILNKKKYAYTTGSLGSVQQTITYTYGDSSWKDKLTAYNGTAITYDAIGNPLNDGTWAYTWERGRQLKSMTSGTTTMEYKYNSNGIRVQKVKKVNGSVSETTNYVLAGNNVRALTKGSNSLYIFFDAQGRPAMVKYNGTMYTYVHNLQGDIVGMVDTSGNLVVEYKYDAWGKPLSKTGSLASTLGTLNPFRYRGYVYDEETGMYYLRSRYYNPVWCRFINVDAVIPRIDSLLGMNLMAYCKNTPVDMIDTDGKDTIAAYDPTPKVPEEVKNLFESYGIELPLGAALMGYKVSSLYVEVYFKKSQRNDYEGKNTYMKYVFKDPDGTFFGHLYRSIKDNEYVQVFLQLKNVYDEQKDLLDKYEVMMGVAGVGTYLLGKAAGLLDDKIKEEVNGYFSRVRIVSRTEVILYNRGGKIAWARLEPIQTVDIW